MARPTMEAQARKSRELNEKQMAFVIWSATPGGLRKPETQAEFAAVIGVTTQSLWRWTKDPRIQDAVRFVVLQNAGKPENVTSILDMLHRKAIDNEDLKAAELWLKGTGVMTNFGRSNSVLDSLDDGVDFSDFSDEELERLKLEGEATTAEAEAIRQARLMIAEAKTTAIEVE